MPTTTRPSTSQARLLNLLADHGGVDVREGDLDVSYSISTWVAVSSHGWVTVDRGTPDNRGGHPRDYRYTITEQGWAGIDRQPNPDGPHIGDVVTVQNPHYALPGERFRLERLDDSTDRQAYLRPFDRETANPRWVALRYLTRA